MDKIIEMLVNSISSAKQQAEAISTEIYNLDLTRANLVRDLQQSQDTQSQLYTAIDILRIQKPKSVIKKTK